MNRQDIEKALAVIRANADDDDDENAHRLEDELYRDFIHHVADTTAGELAECAKLVLSSWDMKFSRWYA